MGASTTGGQTRIGPIWSGANSPGRAGGSGGGSGLSAGCSERAETGASLPCAGSWNASVMTGGGCKRGIDSRGSAAGSALAVAAAQALTYHGPSVAPQRKRCRKQAAGERRRAASVRFQGDPLPRDQVLQGAARQGVGAIRADFHDQPCHDGQLAQL